MPAGAFTYKVEILLYLACLLQLGMLSYNPYNQIPSQADLQAGYALVRLISSVPGEVYLPDHGHLSGLAGKSSYAHHSTIWDMLRADQRNPAAQLLRKELQEAIQQQKFNLIIRDSEWNFYCQQIDSFYTRQDPVFDQAGIFYPVAGWACRPSLV